jgi:hypothetical protein
MRDDRFEVSVTFDERRGYVGHVPDLADVSADVFAAAKPETMKRTLRRVHWSKEASSLGFALEFWPSPRVNRVCYWIIDTMVEAIIR